MIYFVIFAPVTTATVMANSSNQSNLDSNNLTINQTIELSPILGMVVGWPELNQALSNDFKPREILFNNSNETLYDMNETNETIDFENLLSSISNYDTLSYYVDMEERLILNQPDYVLETKDVYLPLDTDYKTELLQMGNVTLGVKLLEENESIFIKADFKENNNSLFGLNSFCKIRENSSGNWGVQFMSYNQTYTSVFGKDNSFMYEVTCVTGENQTTLSTIGTWLKPKPISNSFEDEEESFILEEISAPIIVEDLYINLSDNQTTVDDMEVRPFETSLDLSYDYDSSDVILSAHYLDAIGNPLVGLNSFCELRENSSNNWSSPYFMFYDNATSSYQTVLPADNAFWTQISCYTNDVGEKNLSIVEVVEIEPTSIIEKSLVEEFEGVTTEKSFNAGTDYGIFNLETKEGIITEFTVDEELNIAFRIEKLNVGQSLDVELNLPMEIPENQHLYIWKNLNGENIEVPYELFNSRTKLILHLKDGVVDDDGMMNGIIEDPFQLILTDESTEVTTTSSRSALITLESKQLDVVINKGVLGEVMVVDPRNLPDAPLPPRSFDTNLLKLNITSFDGEGVDVTFHLDENIGDLTVWKFDSKTYEWYEMPYTKIDSRNLKITIIDGGLGDDDGIKNGIIIDDVGIVNNQTAFEAGVENSVYYNNTLNAVMLNNSLGGTYYSDIYGSATESYWQNFTWLTNGNYGQALPNNKDNENFVGGVDMSDNILLYHLDEISGSVTDYSGNNLGASVSGSVSYLQTGKYNDAFYFDGDGSLLTSTSNSALDLNSGITIETWFNLSYSPTSFGDDMYLVDRYTTPAGYALLVDSYGGNDLIGFYLGNTATTRLRSNSKIQTGKWYHVVATYDGNNMTVYINGVLDKTMAATSAYTPYANDLYIGASSGAGSGSFNGTMDEVALYNSALTAQEIKTRYERGILRLNGSVRSCDDVLCSGESWTELVGASPQNLNLINNPYFQYAFTFSTENISYTPMLYNTSVEHMLMIPPNYTRFTGSTTNFGIESNLANVSNALLEIPAYGKIEWNNNIVAAQANFDAYVNLSDNYVFIDTPNLDVSINTQANITLYNITWPHPIIYKDNLICGDCTFLSKQGTNASFQVNGFSNYTLGIGTELLIDDNTNYGSILINEQNIFKANYTDKETGLPLNGAGVYCEFIENSTGSWSTAVNMTYTGGIYELSKSFANAGNYTYNVSCYNNQNYSNLTLLEPFEIYESYPDYSGASYQNQTTVITTEFISGVKLNIKKNTSTHDLILNNSLTGSFTSAIFDGQNVSVWNNVSILKRNIYGKELPNSQGNESVLGGVDMTYNELLFHFEELSGILSDDSGNSNAGYLDGVGASYQTTGIFDDGMNLNGDYTFFEVLDSVSTTLDDTLSIEVWIKPATLPTVTGADMYILDKYSLSGYDRGFTLRLTNSSGNNKLAFGLGNSSTTTLLSNSNIAQDSWNHIIATYDGTEMKLYVNGKLDANKTQVGAYMSFDDSLIIGAPSSSGTNAFNGTIDEVALYENTLTAQEVETRYKRGALNLNFEARSCDDNSCVGDLWTSFGNENEISLNLTNEQYFQYRFNFTSINNFYSPELVNLTINYVREITQYTLFSGNTTDFNNHPKPSSVVGAILEIPEHGKIIWNNPINSINQNFDENVKIINNSVSVNVSALDASINTSANVTLNNISWVYPIIYRNGVICDTCNVYNFTNQKLSFTVNGFSTYTSAEGTNLSINDASDAQIVRVNKQNYFYANYSNISSSNPIIGVDVYCEFIENSSGSWSNPVNMTYNATSKLYELNKSFAVNDTYQFNTSCYNNQGYANITASDSFNISEKAPVELNILNVTYSNNNPEENEEILIYVNITNTGEDNATNFTLQMNTSSWNGTKNFINTNQTNLINLSTNETTLINFTWSAKLGTTVFDFFVDNQNDILEVNELNNTYTKNISINSWVTLYGELNSTVVLGDSNNYTMLNWTAIPKGVMLIADIDSVYLADDLIALDGTGDLAILDSILGMNGFNDSVSKLYDPNNDGDADVITSVDILGTTINNVPAYGLGGSSFLTGILYDSADGVGYNGNQDIVFVVEINATGVGSNGVADYELYVPALLRSLKLGSNSLEYMASLS